MKNVFEDGSDGGMEDKKKEATVPIEIIFLDFAQQNPQQQAHENWFFQCCPGINLGRPTGGPTIMTRSRSFQCVVVQESVFPPKVRQIKLHEDGIN